MKQILHLLTFILASLHVWGQASYTGFIDKYPIELATNIYSDGDARAVYAYSNHDEPIVINGKLQKKQLVLFEKDKSGKNKAKLTFTDFTKESNQLTGTWTDLITGKQLAITLAKSFDMDSEEGPEWTTRELMQTVAVKDKYFKIVISKETGSSDVRVTGIKVLEKKTDKLLQQINLDCQLWGLENVSTGDYNFDGVNEFSVFESSAAGPNTSSLYFLFNPKTNKYFNSGFSGTSLEFDSKTKRIYERNQCCAGREVTNTEYKVVNNKMVMVKKTCLEYNEKKEDYVKVKCD